MPSFPQRLWNIVRGKSNALLDRLEDPEEQLSVFVSELNAQVQDLQRSVAGAIADEKRLHKQIEGLRTKSAEWESRAIVALEDGNESLARAALVKQEECDGEAARAVRSRGRVEPVFVESLEDVPAALTALLLAGDVVLTLGAGDIGGLAKQLPEALVRKGVQA